MPIITLPIAVLAAFIPMYYLNVSSNVMSLGGLALAIGVLVDAAIVMVENGYEHLAERSGLKRRRAYGEPRAPRNADRFCCDAAKQVGPALFYSLVIILVSFLPVFLLEAQEGRMFRPLAWTKTSAVGVFLAAFDHAGSRADAVCSFAGGLRPESENPAARVTQAIYLPVLRWCLRHWKLADRHQSDLSGRDDSACISSSAASSCRRCMKAPPCTCRPRLPGSRFTQATSLMQEQDRIIRSFPEVESVFGTVGRSDSATDNAPLDMYDTTIMLKPQEQWRPGMTYEKLIAEMDAKLQFPGLTNTWTMPVRNRLDMELTGIKTPVGLKIQGPDLAQIQEIGARMQQILTRHAATSSVFAERVSQGLLFERRSQSSRGRAVWAHRWRRAASDYLGHRRRECCSECRGSPALSHQRALRAGFSRRSRSLRPRSRRHSRQARKSQSVR